MTVDLVYTDTFGGEPNYGWVQRESIELHSRSTDRQIVIHAKAAIGLTGVHCTRSVHGDGTIELRPVHSCTVLFITPRFH